MKKNSGQSTIEFLIVSIFALGILIAFIQLTFNLTEGYMAHYATYMASRTFLVYDEADANVQGHYRRAQREARKIFEGYGLNSKGLDFNYPGDSRSSDFFFTGAFYRYKRPMSIFNYLGGGIETHMYSESFLGKEPTRGDCWDRTKKAITSLQIPSDDLKRFTTVFDNGC